MVNLRGFPGIFGTDLEAEALSESLKVPVHIYYREGDAKYSGNPTRMPRLARARIPPA